LTEVRTEKLRVITSGRYEGDGYMIGSALSENPGTRKRKIKPGFSATKFTLRVWEFSTFLLL